MPSGELARRLGSSCGPRIPRFGSAPQGAGRWIRMGVQAPPFRVPSAGAARSGRLPVSGRPGPVTLAVSRLMAYSRVCGSRTSRWMCSPGGGRWSRYRGPAPEGSTDASHLDPPDPAPGPTGRAPLLPSRRPTPGRRARRGGGRGVEPRDRGGCRSGGPADLGATRDAESATFADARAADARRAVVPTPPVSAPHQTRSPGGRPAPNHGPTVAEPAQSVLRPTTSERAGSTRLPTLARWRLAGSRKPDPWTNWTR